MASLCSAEYRLYISLSALVGRAVIKAGERAPKTAESFCALCTGDKGVSSTGKCIYLHLLEHKIAHGTALACIRPAAAVNTTNATTSTAAVAIATATVAAVSSLSL